MRTESKSEPATEVRHPRHHETRLTPTLAARESALKLRSFADLDLTEARTRILGAPTGKKFLGPLSGPLTRDPRNL